MLRDGVMIMIALMFVRSISMSQMDKVYIV